MASMLIIINHLGFKEIRTYFDFFLHSFNLVIKIFGRRRYRAGSGSLRNRLKVNHHAFHSFGAEKIP